MTRSLLAISVLATVPSAVAPLPSRKAPEISRLEDGRTVERQLSRGDDHQYRLTLTSGDCLRIAVEQRGIDVAVQLRDPAGNVIADIDDEVRPRGEEHVDLVADVSGVFTIAIAASPVAMAIGGYAIRIDGRQQATADDRQLQNSRRFRTIAASREAAGRYEEARPLLEHALSLSERARGRQDADVAMVLFDLAENALETRDDARARTLIQRAIGIYEQSFGLDHPYTAMARARLAAIEQRAGNGPKSEALLQQSMAIIERELGTDHLWYVRCLTTQANLRIAAHDPEKAEALQLQIIAILERIQNTNTIQYAVALHNLGEAYLAKHDNQRAEDLLQRSLVVTEAIEGPDSYRVSTKLQNLALIARDEKDYPKALDYNTRALSIRERILGGEHADIAPLLNNLGVIYHVTGDDTRALPLFFRSLYFSVRSRSRLRQRWHKSMRNRVEEPQVAALHHDLEPERRTVYPVIFKRHWLIATIH